MCWPRWEESLTFKHFITNVNMFDGPIGPRLPSASPRLADRWSHTQSGKAALARRPRCRLPAALLTEGGGNRARGLATLRSPLNRSSHVYSTTKRGRHEQIGDILRSREPTRVRRRRGIGLLLVDGVSPSALRSPWLHFNSLASGFFFVFFSAAQPFHANLVSVNLSR